MVSTGKAGSDIGVWGLSHNDFHRSNSGGAEWISILVNGNNPPSVEAGSHFAVHLTDNSYTIPASPTGNNVYPQSTTPTYYKGQAIYEPSQRTFAWNSGAFPAQSDGTWYLYCSGAEDTDATSKGLGSYGASKTETPTWSDEKGGWYSASGYKIIARFVSTSNVVSQVMEYPAGRSQRGYLETKGTYLNGNSLTVQKIAADVGKGKLVRYLQDVVIYADVTSGLTASTWYVILINVATGALTYTAVTTQSSWTGHTLASNLLNASSIYDSDLKFNYVNDATTYYRAIALFKVNAAGNGLDYLFDIPCRVKSFAKYSSNANLVINNNTVTTVDYEDPIFDFNNDVTTGTWVFTARFGGTYSVNAAFYWSNLAGFTTGEQCELKLYINGSAQEYLDFDLLNDPPAGNIYLFQNGGTNIQLKEGDTISIRVNQTSGGNITNTNSTALSYVVIREW